MVVDLKFNQEFIIPESLKVYEFSVSFGCMVIHRSRNNVH
jgi:hypothetical protein